MWVGLTVLIIAEYFIDINEQGVLIVLYSLKSNFSQNLKKHWVGIHTPYFN